MPKQLTAEGKYYHTKDGYWDPSQPYDWAEEYSAYGPTGPPAPTGATWAYNPYPYDPITSPPPPGTVTWQGFEGQSSLMPTVTDNMGHYWKFDPQTGSWINLEGLSSPTAPPSYVGGQPTQAPVASGLYGFGGTREGGGAAPEQAQATARSKASQLLYGAMRGLPFISQSYLGALQAGQTPAPRMMTPQTLGALASDEFLSSNFFALLEAAGLYPTSFLAEVGRFQPRGRDVAPSFF